MNIILKGSYLILLIYK